MRKIHWPSFPCLCTDCVSSLARCLFRYFSSFKLNYFLLLSSNRFFVIRFWIWSFIRYIFSKISFSLWLSIVCSCKRGVRCACICVWMWMHTCPAVSEVRRQPWATALAFFFTAECLFVAGPQACRRFPDSSPTSLQEHQSKRTHHHIRSNIAQYLHGKPFTLWATALARAV